MTNRENHLEAIITFRQPWTMGIEWISGQQAKFQSIRNEWRKRKNYRDDLRRLLATGPHLIPDIGLKIEEAAREAAKPFWVS